VQDLINWHHATERQVGTESCDEVRLPGKASLHSVSGLFHIVPHLTETSLRIHCPFTGAVLLATSCDAVGLFGVHLKGSVFSNGRSPLTFRAEILPLSSEFNNRPNKKPVNIRCQTELKSFVRLNFDPEKEVNVTAKRK
jgi:hypothetical protein